MDLVTHVQTKFAGKNVVVLGDIVADQFLAGTISRVSREAPVFILRHDETVTLPGAAGNAAANVAGLGGTATMVGVVGADDNGDKLVEVLSGKGVSTDSVVRSHSVTTVTKVRVLAGQNYAARQQVIRIDYEPNEMIESEVVSELSANLQQAGRDADAIVVSDYGYGAVSTAIFANAKAIAAERGIPLIVDSRHRLGDFIGATTATPNREEVQQLLGEGFSEEACEGLRVRLGLEALLVTNGNQGMTLFAASKSPLHLGVVGPSEPVDVTGAGDTVIAAYALGLASGLGFCDAARLANHAGGIVVMKKSTATVSTKELLASLAAAADNSRAQTR